ncbi:diphosphomevalonate decarboxylase [Lentibacillus halodurans]|uniref:diphosphomevalonate decarboxylase n=1 Tax=Lentibacillus halodurans TaxID=237679 RepID=A0A1I0Y6U8_9BACI|nr:diphosphomevalonate decarboxylase [Lentibacillus halodurans]SFB08476.1 diphosphomevalonate decarboxylase [Lentibacillus halodurans]
MKAAAKAHTNIALIKYWGKRDESLILPMNNSLSLTLDGFYTTTAVEFQENLTADRFYLNDRLVEGAEYRRVTAFLDRIRQAAGRPDAFAEIHSTNHVPTAAGFASSASGFAALAAATAKAIDLPVNEQQLSIMTRHGSGSACRSIYGGFVEWEKGIKADGSDSYAVPIAPADHWDIRVAAVILSSAEKKVLSREGMRRTVETSSYYPAWVDSIPDDLAAIKDGIAHKDFEKVGVIAEANCLRMHATTLAASPPFSYWQSTTFSIMEAVQDLREAGVPVFFTIDAGPNVKVLYLPEQEETIRSTLLGIPGVHDVTVSRPGQGVSYI